MKKILLCLIPNSCQTVLQCVFSVHESVLVWDGKTDFNKCVCVSVFVFIHLKNHHKKKRLRKICKFYRVYFGITLIIQIKLGLALVSASVCVCVCVP